jgi:cytosine/adenosine deaminase-related metal-dependent hydrolase
VGNAARIFDMSLLIEHLEFALTVDAADTVIRDAAIVVDGDRIADIGPTADVLRRHDRNRFERVIDGSRHGITPGFIDSHVHLSETLSRAVFPDDLDTRTWVFLWAKPFYAHVNAEDEHVGALLGCAEMLRSGTTCLLDMGAQNDPAGTVRAIEQSGIRGITGRHAADNRPASPPPGWSEEMMRHHFFPGPDAALAALEETFERWHNAAHGRIRCWINIEGKEPCTLALHVGARDLAEKHGVGTTYHLATSIEEARISQSKHGVWPVQRLAEAGGLGSNLVIAHGVAINPHERQLLQAHDTKIAFCPGTSLKLAKGATSIGGYPELLDAGVTISLGTDGVSASGNLSLMRQMYLVAGLFKDARNDPAIIGARKALRMATIDGARALLWDDALGSLEIGKKADFVLFDLDHIEWTPYADPVQALVWSASPASIAETWVDGRMVYGDGKLQQIDERALYREARLRAVAITERAGLTGKSIPTSTSLYE